MKKAAYCKGIRTEVKNAKYEPIFDPNNSIIARVFDSKNPDGIKISRADIECKWLYLAGANE